jgi:S-DNA-T family DNA segregation ATPase FtsK/SpoIIIE
MLAAGWHAHTLDAPGKFLLSAEGHDHPRRARAFLVTDDDVRHEAARSAPARPSLDELSANALATASDDTFSEVIDAELIDDTTDPDVTLWTALSEAPDEGHSVPELMMITGMGRTWIYDRLQSHASADRATQVSRGRWRATDPNRQHPAA